MRKEILGVIMVFVLIFTAVSLVSYHPSDPSINRAGISGKVNNLFGPVGAHTAGFLVYLFGLGSFWIPVLLLNASLQTFRGQTKRSIILAVSGGILLAVATGGILSMYQSYYHVFGKRFSGGGIIGIPMAKIVVKYSSRTGGLIFLATVWTVAFIMMTRLSLITFLRSLAAIGSRGIAWARTTLVIWKERRSKARKRIQIGLEQAPTKRPSIKIVARQEKSITKGPPRRQEEFEFMTGFKLPAIDLLEDSESEAGPVDRDSLQMQSRLLEKKLSDFDVSGKVVAVLPGPVVTMYEYEPAPGVKINRVVSLLDDLAMALRAISIRIVAPIPGKSVIGIEVANTDREVVKFKDIIASEAYMDSHSKLTLALGKDILGNPVVTDLGKMPHLLIAGATGSGKSVALNAMICSILFKAAPDEVKLVLIDPKRIELASYEGVPHMISPVVVDAKKATTALRWAVHEMERRYAIMAEKGVRNISQYHKRLAKEQKMSPRPGPADGKAAHETDGQVEDLPFVVVVIDELADLMLVASRDVEVALTRLAQMARAAGIHLLIATQRPSVDVLTGTIKANFPTRISFQVSSRTDSRTILDANGAESLLGNGDMLFLPPGTSKLQRVHGAYISENEIRQIVDFLKRQKEPVYKEEIFEVGQDDGDNSAEDDYDEKHEEAVALVRQTGQASISMIQRRLRVGYNRAARMIEMMERDGIVGPSDGSKPRDVLE